MIAGVSKLLEVARDALAANTPIAAFCQTEFGQLPWVYLGLDFADPPEESRYPLLAIVGVRRTGGGASGRAAYALDLACGVRNEETQKSGRVITLPGFVQAEQLRELAEGALLAARLGKVSLSGEAEAFDFYPLFLSFFTVAVETINSSRS